MITPPTPTGYYFLQGTPQSVVQTPEYQDRLKLPIYGAWDNDPLTQFLVDQNDGPTEFPAYPVPATEFRLLNKTGAGEWVPIAEAALTIHLGYALLDYPQAALDTSYLKLQTFPSSRWPNQENGAFFAAPQDSIIDSCQNAEIGLWTQAPGRPRQFIDRYDQTKRDYGVSFALETLGNNGVKWASITDVPGPLDGHWDLWYADGAIIQEVTAEFTTDNRLIIWALECPYIPKGARLKLVCDGTGALCDYGNSMFLEIAPFYWTNTMDWQLPTEP
jgi:hypothetical protein